ncbi:unnamed protein product, partial [Closterium sp. Naga37s-1]
GAAHGGGARLPPHAHRAPASTAATLLSCSPSVTPVPRLNGAAGGASRFVISRPLR